MKLSHKRKIGTVPFPLLCKLCQKSKWVDSRRLLAVFFFFKGENPIDNFSSHTYFLSAVLALEKELLLWFAYGMINKRNRDHLTHKRPDSSRSLLKNGSGLGVLLERTEICKVQIVQIGSKVAQSHSALRNWRHRPAFPLCQPFQT